MARNALKTCHTVLSLSVVLQIMREEKRFYWSIRQPLLNMHQTKISTNTQSLTYVSSILKSTRMYFFSWKILGSADFIILNVILLRHLSIYLKINKIRKIIIYSLINRCLFWRKNPSLDIDPPYVKFMFGSYFAFFSFLNLYYNSPGISKRVNLKTGVSRKQSKPNFPKKPEHFLPPDTHT